MLYHASVRCYTSVVLRVAYSLDLNCESGSRAKTLAISCRRSRFFWRRYTIDTRSTFSIVLHDLMKTS